MLFLHQILHFRTFGYVLLPGLLSPAEAATLRDEVSGALADAFEEPSPGQDALGGISGDYLPLAVNRAPLSISLIADDPRTFLASAELLGSPTVPTIGIATCSTGDGTPGRDRTSAASRSGQTWSCAPPIPERCGSFPARSCPSSSGGCASTPPPSRPPPASSTGTGRTSRWRPGPVTWSHSTARPFALVRLTTRPRRVGVRRAQDARHGCAAIRVELRPGSLDYE